MEEALEGREEWAQEKREGMVRDNEEWDFDERD